MLATLSPPFLTGIYRVDKSMPASACSDEAMSYCIPCAQRQNGAHNDLRNSILFKIPLKRRLMKQGVVLVVNDPEIPFYHLPRVTGIQVRRSGSDIPLLWR